ncbi:TetR/AcrR family transcriptional regulator [Jiulongibacter sp. NS-SX5]|uniref:TetR/AcrR family transcriptional regulator n=1 Tax=Jiulongibacter sp. NS-SX5 TaxID=3463854 RepID=UPI0040581D56
MQLGFQIKMNPGLYLKDPDNSEIGRRIIKNSIPLIAEHGYEQFTFRKLAIKIKSTEATIYRYFENKHKLLIYLMDLYWAFIQFQVHFQINNISSPKQKIERIVDLLVWEDNDSQDYLDLDQKALYHIAVAESSKTYLSKDVDEHNKEMFYKPYKDLCVLIASIFKEYNPNYEYSRTLASSIVELSHCQFYFMNHLPNLCDFSDKKDPKEVEAFLESLIFSSLKSA